VQVVRFRKCAVLASAKLHICEWTQKFAIAGGLAAWELLISLQKVQTCIYLCSFSAISIF
jgi:hypothetical protein